MNTKALKCITAAVSLLVAASTVEAVTINLVDILNGLVDVNQDGVVNGLDDLNNVALWCNDAAPTQVDIINGEVDVTEDVPTPLVDASDDLDNCDLNDENNMGGIAVLVPTTNPVDIIAGEIDVNEDNFISNGTSDDAFNVKLFVLP